MIADKAMNTHIRVRDFQNKLYLTAKADRKRKFYALYDKIYRKDILEEAWKRVKQNGGAGGIDKISIEDVKAYGEEKLLDEIAEELRTEKYRCKPVRRTYIPKADGRKRALGIPTIKAMKKMRANIKAVFASPSRLLLSMEDMVKLLNPKIIGMRNYYARRFTRPWMWKIDKYINFKFTHWYNRKKQRNYRRGNAAMIRELTIKAGLACICG